MIDKLSEPFMTVNTKGLNSQGIGLGLNISKRIIT